MDASITYESLDALMSAMAYLKDEDPPLVGIAVSEQLYWQIEQDVIKTTAIPFNGILLGTPIHIRKELNGAKRQCWPIYPPVALDMKGIPFYRQ